ncbi:MAG: hypothetical protein JST21_10480 [Bacteroidetes bacterium]|nr:hypothetical protein [Bacteroidota bacterium]
MMKQLIAISFLFFGFQLHAQVMQAKAVWSTIKVPQLKCWECQQRLDQYLIKEKGPNTDAGIIQWRDDLRNATIKIQYFPDRITLDYIRTSIANAGFDADTITAEPDSYKRLPLACRKATDGKGYGPYKYCELDPADRPKD